MRILYSIFDIICPQIKQTLDDRFKKLLSVLSESYVALHELAQQSIEDKDEEQEEKMKAPRSLMDGVRKVYGIVVRRLLLFHGVCTGPDGTADWEQFKSLDGSLHGLQTAHLESHIIETYFLSMPWKNAHNPLGIPLSDIKGLDPMKGEDEEVCSGCVSMEVQAGRHLKGGCTCHSLLLYSVPFPNCSRQRDR